MNQSDTNVLICQAENFISPGEQKFIDDVILGNNFPWYWNDASTSYKYPFMCHTMIKRYDHEIEQPSVNSDYFFFFKDIFDKFCAANNIEVKQILRASLNLVTHHSDLVGEAHVDHLCDHTTVLMYLNDATGDTVIFDKLAGNEYEVLNGNSLPILAKIPPQKGKVVCFDGRFYHAAEFPKEGQRRVVCVITFLRGQPFTSH